MSGVLHLLRMPGGENLLLQYLTDPDLSAVQAVSRSDNRTITHWIREREARGIPQARLDLYERTVYITIAKRVLMRHTNQWINQCGIRKFSLTVHLALSQQLVIQVEPSSGVAMMTVHSAFPGVPFQMGEYAKAHFHEMARDMGINPNRQVYADPCACTLAIQEGGSILCSAIVEFVARWGYHSVRKNIYAVTSSSNTNILRFLSSLEIVKEQATV